MRWYQRPEDRLDPPLKKCERGEHYIEVGADYCLCRDVVVHAHYYMPRREHWLARLLFRQRPGRLDGLVVVVRRGAAVLR